MYLNRGQSCCVGNEQRASRGCFLLLLHVENSPCIFAVVRKVALRQLGCFMMGRANIRGKWISVSGSYGNDGLPVVVKRMPEDAVLLPDELRHAWSKGGGWNSAGGEAQAMRSWAKRFFKIA